MELRFVSEQDQTRARITRHVEACIETGNFDKARLAVEEFRELDPEGAKALCTLIVPKYGTTF